MDACCMLHVAPAVYFIMLRLAPVSANCTLLLPYIFLTLTALFTRGVRDKIGCKIV